MLELVLFISLKSSWPPGAFNFIGLFLGHCHVVEGFLTCSLDRVNAQKHFGKGMKG
jgi:hypothetical protein